MSLVSAEQIELSVTCSRGADREQPSKDDESLAVDASDVVDATPACSVVSVQSSEDVNGQGDGDTAPDWAVEPASLVAQLRAERGGSGPGRVYTIALRCVDGSGNASVGSAVVVVPKSEGK